MTYDLFLSIVILALLVGGWIFVIGMYVAMRRRAARRELLTLRLRACARLQLPMTQALENPSGAPREVASIMRETAQKMEGGQRLSEALGDDWACIPQWYTRTLAVGEATGNLEGAFDLLVRTDERGEELRLDYFTELLYPLCLLLMVTSVLESIFVYVIPQFNRMFTEMGLSESSLQSTMRSFGLLFAQFAPLVLLVFGTVVFSLMPFPWGPRWTRFTPVRWWTWIWRRVIPGLGRAYFRAATARWAGMVSLMLNAGSSLPRALEISADIESDSRVRKAARRWAEKVSSGQSLSSAMSDYRFVPRSMVWQVRCAEGGSDLPGVLREAGERETAILQRKLSSLLRMSTPFFVAAIGAVVGLVAVGLFSYMINGMYALM